MLLRCPCMTTFWVSLSCWETTSFQQTDCNTPGYFLLSECDVMMEILGHTNKHSQESAQVSPQNSFGLSKFYSSPSFHWSVLSSVRTASFLYISTHEIPIDPTVWISSWKTSQYAAAAVKQASEAAMKCSLTTNQHSSLHSPQWSSHRLFSDFVSLIVWLCLCLCISPFISYKGALMKGWLG